MTDIIIFAVIAVAVVVGVLSSRKHFKGQGDCCGGGGQVVIEKKKLDHVTGTKTVLIEGMTCEHCVRRVTRYINEIDGAAAKVSLAKKSAAVSMNRDVTDEELCAAVEKAGYKVIEIRA